MPSDKSTVVAVTLRVEDWLGLMDVMDNAVLSEVEDGDPADIAPIASRVREAAGASAYETDELQLAHDRLTSVELPISDWRYAVLTLAEWAEVADGMTPGVDPDGTFERALMSGIMRQLPESSVNTD